MLTHSQAANVISIIQNDVLQQVNTTTFWPKGKHATHCNTLTGRRLTDTHTHTHTHTVTGGVVVTATVLQHV